MKKVIVLASLALLLGGALLLQTGCPQPLGERGRDQTGWQIRLNVQAPVSAMAIEVSEYEVTGLLIELYDPQGELLRTIEWEATGGPRSYTIAVQERGQYQISVTHYGQKDGRTVEATESAAFNIQAMRITVINVVPGAIGVIGVDPGESEPDEETGTGLLTVGGNTYLLSELVFTVYGEVDGSGVFEFDVIICSEGTLEAVQGEDPNGVYNVVYLIMFSPESELAEGTYLPGGESQDPLTFSTPADDDASEIWIGFRPAEWEFEKRYRIIAGAVEISVNGSIYTINGDVTLADDEADDILASFTFVGPVAAILPPGDDDNDDNGNGD